MARERFAIETIREYNAEVLSLSASKAAELAVKKVGKDLAIALVQLSVLRKESKDRVIERLKQ